MRKIFKKCDPGYHPWFAWRPIVLEGKDTNILVWLEWIERRTWYDTLGNGYRSYRLPQRA